MRSLFVTGESGFVGHHVVSMRDELLHRYGWELIHTGPSYDLLDPASMATLFARILPDAVVHLAGISFVPDSLRDPRATYDVNVIGTLNLLQTLKKMGFSGSFIYVSTGDVYGRLAEAELPVNETRLPRPLNPYAASKVAAEALCYQWAQTENFNRIVIARPFNHIGAGQREDFVLPSIARQIMRIKHGKQEPVLMTGNIDVTRDFLDVTDVIRAYLELLEFGENGETYNVCSGKERAILNLITSMLDFAGVPAEIKPDPTRYRPADQPRACGDNRRLLSATGWQPTVPIEVSLKNVLQYWESRVQ